MGRKVRRVGVIMPWEREPRVRIYDVSKWKEDALIDDEMLQTAIALCRRSVGYHHKWRGVLDKYNVGSHVEKSMALRIAAVPEKMFPRF